MPPLFPNAWQVPGIQGTLDTFQNIMWWGPKVLQVITNVFLDANTVDAGNTPTTVLRPGLLLGFKPATNKWIQWTPTATDGSQYISGVLLYDQQMLTTGNVAADRWFGYAMMRGLLKANSLLIPGNANLGIVGDPLEFLVRAQLTQGGKFTLDDNYTADEFAGWSTTHDSTADATITTAMNNTLFTTLGAAGAVNFTLPAPQKGLRYGFFNAVDQNMTVTAAAAGQLITFNNAAAASVAFSTAGNKIGGRIEVVGISATKWAVIPSGANTLTVA